MKYNRQKTKTKLQKAFTLLELLLVIAVIAILAAVIFFNLSPAKRLGDTESAKTLAKSKDIKKAIEAYSIANGGSLPTSISGLSAYGLFDICKQGQSTNCVNLDELVTGGYISEIPIDDSADSAIVSGYKLEYDSNKRTVQILSNSNYQTYIVNGSSLQKGLVGYWRMDEASGTSAQDSSGNNNIGTLTNGPTWGNGKYNNAVVLDGSNDYISISSTSSFNTAQFTLSQWWYATGATCGATWSGPFNNRVASQNGFQFVNDTNSTTVFTPHLVIWNGTSETAQYKSTTTYNCPFTGWKHFVWVYSGSGTPKLYVDNIEQTVTTSAITTYNNPGIFIGRGYSYVLGSIDETRLYNRPLNTDEISVLYNFTAPPLAQWKFDEGSGSTAQDSSSNNYVTNSFLGNTSWTNGIYGKALTFDGNGDYVTINDTANLRLAKNFTVMTWVNLTANSADWVRLVGKGNTTDRNYGLWLSSTGNILFQLYSSGGNCDLHAGNIAYGSGWHHITGSYNGSNVYLYKNGLQVGTAACTITPATSIDNLTFGYAGFHTYLNGSLDDIRIYNYQMTQTQIQKVMNNEI